MSESTLKPFTGKLDENIDTNQQPALKPFTGALDGEKKGVMGHLKDTGLSALKGAVAVPELAVGIMDVMSDGATGKTLENKDGTVGFRPKEAKQALGDLHTDQYKAQQQEFADAGKDGNWVDKVVDKTKVALTNPSLIANTVVESVPSMLAGGVLGRASGIANPVVAGAVGEGTVMAGSQAEQIRQETVDGRLTADQSLAGATTGILGGLIGFAGGRLAQKMGIGDVDTMLVTGRAGPAEIAGEIASMPAKSLPRRVVEGAISEGFLEELPQSVSEQILQNLALDKPWNDGVEDAAVMGTLAGMAMGGAANILSGHNTGTESQDNQQQSGSPNLPITPPQLGSSPDNALTGEYIPRENVPQGDNQGRTAFVYDQPSMEADNLLNNNYRGDADSNTSGNFDPSNNPDSPLSPSGGNYFEDHSTQPQLPSERLGINPEDGPMSSAAALAVDTGASPVAQLGYTEQQQGQEQGNTPISDAVPSNYQSLLGSQNDGQPFDARLEDATVQQGNTQADNAGESISQQYDANAADAMGGGIETDRAKTTTAQTAQPILGQDGKNKWFGNQEKAQAFIDKKKLGNDYQVVQDGKRFEIQPKSQVAQTQNNNLNNQNTISNTENNIDKIQKISALEQQLKNEKSVPKKAQIRKQITELQNGLADQAQSEVNLDQPRKATAENLSGEFKKMEESTARVNAVRQRMREANPEIFTAENDRVRETHGLTNARVTMMADEIETSGSYELSDREYEKIYNNPNFKIDYNPKTYTGTVTAIKDPHTGEWLGGNDSIDQAPSSNLQQDIQQFINENKAAFATNWQRDGQLKAQARDVIEKKLDTLLPSDISKQEFQAHVDRAMEYANKQHPTIEAQHEAQNTASEHPVNKWQAEMQEALSKADPEHPLFKKLQASAKNGLRSVADRAVTLRQAREIEKKEKNASAEKDDIKSKLTTLLKNTSLNSRNREYYKAASQLGWEYKDGVSVNPENGYGIKTNSRGQFIVDPEGNEVQAPYDGNKTVGEMFTEFEAIMDENSKLSQAKPEKPKAKAEPSKNTLVSDDRAAELRARLKAKLSQLNSGIDPEIMAIGAELAVYHIERGARKFAALAKNIANDLDVSVEKIRPYLRSWYNGARDMMEDMGADIQGMDNAETVRAELAKLDNPQQSNTVQSKTETVVTPSGREFEVQHKVIEANDLIVSNLDTGAVNPQFPQQLQPRDRTRMSSITQVNEMANKLNPKLLGDSSSSTNGAPIVSNSNEVESGNGRTLAIRKAYQLGKADRYKAWLQEQGYDVTNMDQPILVRERITEMSMDERIAYTKESNERATLDLSPSEQAMSDAPKVMDLLHLLKGNNFNSSVNRAFTNAFLTNVVSTNERATMLDKDGISLTQDGYRRISSALLAAAFNDQEIITQVVENKDTEIKAIGSALLDVAPKWAEVRQGVIDGVLAEGVDISANLVEAVHLIRKARLQNKSVNELVNQDDIFSGEIDQVTKDLIKVFYSGDTLNKARSREKVTEALNNYATLALTVKSGPNIFGEQPFTGKELVGKVNDKIKQSEVEKQQDIFSSPGTNDTNTGESSQVGQRSETESRNGKASGSETGLNNTRIELPTNDTQLVKDWGVQYLDGHARNDQYPGEIETDYGLKDGVKAAFLKDSKKYLEAVQKNLESIGYELHVGKKGKPEKVSVNESGVASSGEVSLYIREPISNTNVYLKVGDGFPGSHPQRIGILYRASVDAKDKQASGFGIKNSGNNYAGANTTAYEMAQRIDDMVARLVKTNQVKANEQPTSINADQQGTSEVRSTGRTTQRTDSQKSDSNVEAELSRSNRNNESKAVGQSSVRDTTANVANNGGSASVGNESNGRKGASGTTTLSAELTKLESSAGVASQAKDFFMAVPEDNVGGSQRQRFNKNKAALELLDELQSEGRQATSEEQYVLASFTGWGSFGQDLFQGTWNTPVFKDDWKEENLWIREKLGQESWESAKDSIINAFFTDPYTVQGMWSMAEKMGFTGGRVLEPAVGTGNFISLMPLHLKSRSQITAIDLDITAAAISKQLFPESNVQNMPYQKSKTPDNFYDLVISNVPFSNDVKIADRRYNQFNPNLHDYFFLKTLDQVRPGGIVMAITSSGTMDKQSEVIRRELAKKAELITSVRLPSGAFKEYAGTAVVTDIIVLRKRTEPLTMTPDESWIGLSEVRTSTKPVKVNSFYAENLQNVLGTIDYKGGDPRFAGMTVHAPSDLKQKLETISDLVPEGALLPRHTEDHLTYYANKSGERTNTLTMSDGKLMYVYGDQMVEATELVKYELKSAKDTAARKQSIEDLVAIRQTYTQLIDAERSDQDNAEKIRKELNKQYQAYVKAHGPLEKSFGLQYFKKIEDAYYFSLAALEQKGKPADILKRSVVRGKAAMENPSVSDAFVIARNQSTTPSIRQIAQMANVSEDQARTELLAKGAVYEMPNGDVQPSDIYLSGNVRHKLEEAQNAVADNPALQRNIDALKEVIPEDIPYFNIETKMGATWVPMSDYENYVAHMLGMTDTKGIEVTAPSGKWKVKLASHIKNRLEATTNYGSKEKSFQTLVSAALSNQTITVKRRDSEGGEYVDVGATEEVNGKIAKIKEDFADWLWSDPVRRVQLEKEYNHTFNAWATPKYDGSFMTMQGMALSLGNGPFNLRQHQQNAIWRAIVNRRSINAHEVGTGKTFTMGGIAVESRRYGIAKKPLILAHNANSSAVAKEIQMMYPSARVLFISEMGKAVRQIRLRQIANDDWDVVVMPHSMIDKLTLSEETLMAMAADDIAALESELEEALAEEGGATLEEVLAMDSEALAKKLTFKSPTAKEIAKTRLNLIEKIQKQAQESSKADAVNFEELGVDMIMVDEVHEFKKPSIATRMKMKGLNNSDNKRSVNLQLLTRYIRRMNNGGNVHTFTGTPITNTLTEIYHQMRYVMEEAMQQLNVANWDGWFGSFATDIQDIELSATGDYQLVSRLAGFVNVPELRKMIGQYMDIVFADDMPEMQPRKTKSGKLLSDPTLTDAEKAELINGRTENAKDRPYKKVINVTTEMSPKQEKALSDIQGYAKEWEAADGKKKRKWMRDGDHRAPLSISTAAKKASYDVRINDPEYVGKEGIAEDYETSKASQVVKNVMEIYKSHPLASQVIFADTGYSTSTERSTGMKDAKGKTIRQRVQIFSPIKDIVERLVQQGIPREQIAIVDGSVKAEARKAIADKVNTGEIRVVIGLTQTLGVGVNMQKNLRAMHHLDAPWMPGELEQRNGRGLRQGNQWNTVLEYRYITDRLDGKSWQVLAIKQRFINAFMKADANVRSIEGDAAADNDGDNGGDIMSSFSEAAGDPRVLMRIQSKGKVEALQRKERLHTQGIADMQRTIGNMQRRVEHLDRQINEFESENVLGQIQDLLKVQSDTFAMKVNGTAFDKRKDAEEAIKQYIADHVRMGAEARKFAEYAGHPLLIEWNSLDVQPKLIMRVGGQEYVANTLRGLESQLRGAPQALDKLVQDKAAAQDTIENLRKAVKQPFAKAEQLVREQKKLEDLEADLVNNPVAPPMWLRQGAPVDSEVYYNGKLFVVSGHKYTQDGWFVTADDGQGSIQIPYMEATDHVGMPIYEEREFEAPKIDDKTAKEEQSKNSEDRKTDEPLYSRQSSDQKGGQTVNQVRETLIKRFGKATIEALEKQGKLEIIQDYQVEGVEGFYHNGKAVLVASNLTAESIVPTFLHELGGHAGFQNMMNQKQYDELMNQFNKLVEQGNPVAMAAKVLAEREQGSERQQLEYLPYLLTLSATMQQRNVLQRNALQKLINNIISYVKAWVFDHFGINLNLNPDDMLALSERMIGQIKHQSSLDLVRQKYHGTNQWMKAPNGAATHLSEQQWLQVRTSEFKKWFGDWENDAANASQVLDENGEPKVVYHGTASEFNEFKQGHGILGNGIYLTDSFDTADVYANIRGKNGFVLPLFVNIRNAFQTTVNVSRDEIVKATSTGKYQGVIHHFDDQEYIVALEPNQVKMAEGNTGTFNSESADIRFSRSAKDIIDNLSKNLSNISVSSIKEKTGYKFTDWLGIGLSALGRRQLTEIYSKLLPQLNKYNDLAAQMDADKNDAGAEADSIVREWANLKDEDQLAELMHDSTLAKIDPTKPYVKGDSVSRYKQLRDDYNSLSPEAQAMYLKARDAYKKHYAKVHQAIKERILRSELSSQKKADLLKQMDDNFFGYVKGVYFPLARFGKYVVVMRNQNGEVESVSRAETMGEAQSLRSELMQKYPHYKTDRVMLDKEFNASRDAVGRGFMTNLFAEVDNLGLSTAEQAEFEDTLSQLYLSSMPDLSWAKHGIHRKGTAGFSQDARRAFAQNMFHGAGYLAKLRYGDQLAQQLDDMQKYASEQSKLNDSYDQPTAQRVIDEMNKRHDNLMNPKSHPLSSALTSLGFIYYLGLSPAAAMVNLSQTALVAYPIMGAKWGFDKAANELLKASNDFRKGVEFHKVKWEGSKTDLYKTISSDISKFLSKDEKQAYEDAVARGVIDVTQAHDLAGIAQGEDSGIMWKTRPIMRAASVMFHSAERFNREVTFIAAYRLARQSGEKHDSAFDQAVDATYRGHFDYSSGNRPRIMQGNVAKVLLLFKQFGQNMVYTLARQTYQSIKGETEAERKEARKSLGAILAMHATFAGTLGLPMVGMLLSLASWAGGDDDDPWDAEVALRNYLAEAFGPTISTLLMKGAPRAFTPFDMSGRVGINNMLLPDVQEGLEGKRWAESAMAGALGPVAGIGTNLVKGGQDITEGQTLRGIETMLPVFLKNFAKTYRYADEGVQDKTGVSIMDEVSSMDLLVQGMGFSPSDVRTANEGKTAIYQLNRKLNERRSRLMTLWSRAKMMDDQQEMDEIWEEIQGFNDKNPSRRITRINLNQSYRNRQRRIDRAEDGIYLSRNRQDAREAGYFAFGE